MAAHQPAPPTSGWWAQSREAVGAALAFAMFALWMTWPLALQLDHALPIGNYDHATVSLSQVWALDHMLDAALGGFRGYWHAPIFHPTRGTFALSEAGPVSAILGAPARALGGPVLAYNFVLLVALTLNGWTSWLLLRRLGAAFVPALASGLLVQQLPTLHLDLAVLPLLQLWPVVLLVLATIQWLSTPCPRTGLLLGCAVALTYLSCFHYGLLAVMALAPAGLTLLRRRHLQPRALLGLGLGVLATALLIAPIVVGQRTWLQGAGYRRSEAAVEMFAATPEQALWTMWPAWLQPPFVRVVPGRGYFMGTLETLLAGYGAWVGAGSLDLEPPSDDAELAGAQRTRERGTVLVVVAFLAASAIATAPSWTLGEFSLYGALARLVPGFEQIRNLTRAATLAQLFAALSAGVGLSLVWELRERWPTARARRLHLGAWLVLAAVALLELRPPRGQLYQAPAELAEPRWTQWIARHTPADAVLAWFPEPPTPYPPDYEPVAELMVLGHHHQRAQLGGYSSYFPADYRRARPALQRFPSLAALDAARELGATHAIVDLELIPMSTIAAVPGLARGIELVHHDEMRQVAVYALRGN